MPLNPFIKIVPIPDALPLTVKVTLVMPVGTITHESPTVRPAVPCAVNTNTVGVLWIVAIVIVPVMGVFRAAVLVVNVTLAGAVTVSGEVVKVP